MNTELMLRVADAIEAHPERFDMSEWIYADPCGTSGCIAGWTVMTACGDRLRVYNTKQITLDGHVAGTASLAQDLLGLDDETADNLFFMSEWPNDIREQIDEGEMSEAQGAAIMLRRMAGVVAEPEKNEELVFA